MDRPSYISRQADQLPPSPIRRFFELVESTPDAISLSIGEPDFVTPWAIREAAIFSLERGQTHYSPNLGFLELRQEVAAYLQRHRGLTYDPASEIIITVGVSEGLDLACRALIDPGDRVIVPEPAYVSYRPGVLMAYGEPVAVSTSPEDGFKLRAEHIVDGKALLTGYPNNPTGAVMSRADWEPVVDAICRRDLVVISDEIYAELTYDGEHVSPAQLPGMQERTVLLGGFSKGFAMTGWRLGYAAGPAPIIGAMNRIHGYTMLCAPTPTQKAALEALRREPGLQEMRAEYNQRRRMVLARLGDMGLDCFEPQGAFYAFPSIRRTGLTSEAFAERLLAEEKVAVVPGNAFGTIGEGHVRCCYATATELLEEALARMARFVQRHP
jgi:aminotransferase